MPARSSYPRWTAGSLRRERTVRCRSMTSPRVGGTPLPALACVCVLALLGAVFPFRTVGSAASTSTNIPSPRAAVAPLHGAHLPAVHPLDTTHLRRVSLSTRTHPVGPAVVQASALNPTQSVAPGGAVRNDFYSTNWSGQVLLGSGITGVSGDWVVPAVAASASDEYSASWIGIDGTTVNSLIQTGTAQQYVGGSPSTTPGSRCCRGTRV